MSNKWEQVKGKCLVYDENVDILLYFSIILIYVTVCFLSSLLPLI